MTSPHRISVRLLAATFAFCVVGAQAQMQPGVAQKTERRASPLKPVAPSAVQPLAASPIKTGLEDKKNLISSGSTAGGENAQQQREAAAERSKGAPAGSLVGDAQQGDVAAPQVSERRAATGPGAFVPKGPGKLEIEAPCSSAPQGLVLIQPDKRAVFDRLREFSVEWGERIEIPVCATPGWGAYKWETFGTSDFEISDMDKPRATLSISGKDSSKFLRADGQWRAIFSGRLYVEEPSLRAGTGRQYANILFEIVMRNAPTKPTITKVYIEDYRPGRSGALDNFGVVDPAIVSNPESIDGEFYIEGTGLAPRDRKVTIGGREATVLQYTTNAGVERIKAKARDFAPGNVVVEGVAGLKGQSPQPLKRLGWWMMDKALLTDFLANSSVVIGSPRGQGSFTVAGQASSFVVDGFRQGGVSIDVIDMRSQPFTIVARQAGDEIEYTVTIPFETDGKELDGTFLSNVDVWQCGSFQVPKSQCGSTDIGCFIGVIGSALSSSSSCLNLSNWSTKSVPGPSVALSGDLTSPQATLTIKLGIGNGKLVHRSATINFSAGIELSAAGVPLPVDAIRSQILTEVNLKLTQMMDPNVIGRQLAEKLGLLVAVGAGQTSVLDHLRVIRDGSVFVGFHRP